MTRKRHMCSHTWSPWGQVWWPQWTGRLLGYSDHCWPSHCLGLQQELTKISGCVLFVVCVVCCARVRVCMSGACIVWCVCCVFRWFTALEYIQYQILHTEWPESAPTTNINGTTVIVRQVSIYVWIKLTRFTAEMVLTGVCGQSKRTDWHKETTEHESNWDETETGRTSRENERTNWTNEHRKQSGAAEEKEDQCEDRRDTVSSTRAGPTCWDWPDVNAKGKRCLWPTCGTYLRAVDCAEPRGPTLLPAGQRSH